MPRSNILVKLSGDPDDARAAVRSVREDLRQLNREEATARINVRAEGVKAQIDRLSQRLERLSKQEATPEVKIRMARVVEQIDRLELKLDRLDAKRVQVDIDVKRGSVERTTAALGSVERALGKVAGGAGGIPFVGGILAAPFQLAGLVASGLQKLPQLLDSIASVATSAFQTVSDGLRAVLNGTSTAGQALGSLFTSLVSSIASGGVALLAMIPVVGVLAVAISALASVIGALVGTLAALVASLAFAAAGAAAVGVALVAALGPALLVVAGFVKQLVQTLLARRQAEQQVTQAAQAQRAADQQRAAAAGQLRQAEQSLADATVAGRKAAAQAIYDERNAQLALQDSQLGLKGSRLAVLDAKKQLRDLVSAAGVAGPALNSLVKKFTSVDFDPSKIGRVTGAVRGAGGQVNDPLALAHAILNVQQAQQGVKDAVNQTATAERNLAQATKTRTQYAREGIRAYAPYRNALEQVQRSESNLATAQDKAAHAQDRYNQKLGELTTTQRGFLGTLDPFLAKLKQVSEIVTRPIFDGLSNALQSITKLISDPSVQAGFTAIGRAIGNFIADFARTLSTQQWRTAIAQFAQDAARFIGQAARGFGYLSTILREIARTAMPELIKMARDVTTWLGRIASKPGEIHHAVKFVVDQFRTWLSIAGHLASAVIGFLSAATGSSSQLAGHIDHLVGKFDKWINSKQGMHDVREFLRQSVVHIKSLADKLPGVLSAFQHIADVVNAIVDATKKIADFLKFNSGESTQTSVDAILADKKIIETETATLKRHLTPEERKGARQRLAEALRDIEKNGGKLAAPAFELLKRLQGLGFAQGGLVPGSGSGDTVPAMLTAGEFVVRKSVVQQLGLPVLQALSGGGSVAPAMAGTVGNVFNNTIVVPGGGPPDPRTLAAKLERELRLAG